MTSPHLLNLLLFLFVLQTMLCAWPGGEEKLKVGEVKTGEVNSRNKIITDGSNFSIAVERGTTLEVKEAPASNVKLERGSLAGISIEALDPSAHYSAAAKEKLAKSLKELAVNHPNIAEEVQTWKAANFSYSALEKLKQKIIKNLPSEINEPFQQGLAMVKELRLQAKQAEVDSSKEEAEKLYQNAAAVQTRAYEAREKYAQQQVQKIKEISSVHDAVERNKMLRQAEQVASKIQSETPTWIGSLLSTILSSTPTATKLVAKFKRASSIQEQLAALHEIKKIDFELDFKQLDILDLNLENKDQLLKLLEAMIKRKNPDTLTVNVFLQIAVLEKLFPLLENKSDQLGAENLQASLKEKRQASLDRINTLAPASLLTEKLTSENREEKVTIDFNIVCGLINNTPINVGEGLSLIEAKKELEKEVFRFFCADIALKFDQAYNLERGSKWNDYKTIISQTKEIDFDKAFDETMKRLNEPSSELAEKLRYMSLFLEVLGSETSFFIPRPNSAADMLRFKRWVYPFLNQADAFVNYYLSHPTQPSNTEFLPIVTAESQRCFRAGYFLGQGRIQASMMELTRARRDQQNNKVAEYHLQAALFLLKSARETIEQRGDNAFSLRLRKIGELYALAAYRERNTGSLSWRSSMVAEDNMTAEDYADAARKEIAGEECLINNHVPNFGNKALRSSETKFYRFQLERRLLLPSSDYGESYGIDINYGTEDPIHF